MITPALWQPREDEWIEGDIQEAALVRLKKVLTEVEKAREAARKTAEEKRRKAKARYNKRLYIKVYQVGDEVLLHIFGKRTRFLVSGKDHTWLRRSTRADDTDCSISSTTLCMAKNFDHTDAGRI